MTGKDIPHALHRHTVKQVLGIPIAAVPLAQALDIIDTAINEKTKLDIGVVNAAKVVKMHRDRSLADAVLSADIIFADGMSVVWASRLLGAALPERVTGIDLMYGMLDRGRQRGYRVYLLGATEAVSQAVAARIAADYPGVVVAGRHHGYYDESAEPQIAAEIAQARADILLVAITSPKKEKFIARWAESIGVSVCHGVGGSFDVFAGITKRAPPSWQRLGLEWLYRLLQEPGRLWRRYLTTNIAFASLVAKNLIRKDTAGLGRTQ